MFEVGRVCVKLAGRDAGKHCVVLEPIESGFVLVDGETRRRKINASHLLPIDKTLDVAKGADHAAVAEAFKTLNIEVKTTKAKKAGERPRKSRKSSAKPAKKEAKKKTVKKAAKKKAAEKTE